MNVSDKGGAGGQSGPPGATWRILCIDDDPEILSLLRMTLRMHHEVVTAESGVEALKIIGLCEPDFIICDVRMPGMDGFETVAAIRKHPAYANIPVFFLTAEKSRGAARRGFEVGCNLYLHKPFDPMRLLENIDYFCRESGHTVRAKSRTPAELDPLIEAARQAPASVPEPAPAAPAPRPPVQPAAPPPAEAPAEVGTTVVQVDAITSEDLEAEHEAFLADRKRREREFWAKRYANIQEFIDRHMND